jgi:glycosyltransferase involved in cell wall biosynthesis
VTGRVAVLIPCRDEEAVLPRKIRNTLSLEFPDGGPHAVLVVDDHSRDGALAAAFARVTALARRPDVEVRLLRSRRPPGKTGALAEGLEAARGFDAVLITDADVLLEPDALPRLLERLAAPGVGLVTGEQRFAERIGEEGPEGEADTLYDRLTRRVRRWESRRGSVFSVHGECLALRASDGLAPEPGIPADDLDLALAARRKGLGVVYAEGARFHEVRPSGWRARGAQRLRRARSFVDFVLRRWSALRDRRLPAGDRLALLLYFLAPFAASALFLGGAAAWALVLASGPGPLGWFLLGLSAGALLAFRSGRDLSLRLLAIARALLERALGLRAGDRWVPAH